MRGIVPSAWRLISRRCASGDLRRNRYNVAIRMRRVLSLAVPRSGAGPRIYMTSQGGIMQAVKGLFMEKWLCWVSMGLAGLCLLLFLLDLFLSAPFGGISATVDVLVILACGVVLYLAYDAFRDLR